MNLSDRILANEVTIRVGFLFGIFSIMAIWEALIESLRASIRTSFQVILRGKGQLSMAYDIHQFFPSPEPPSLRFILRLLTELFSPRRLLTTSIGIHNYYDPRQVSWLSGILLLPFMGKITAYAINRREWSSDEK